MQRLSNRKLRIKTRLKAWKNQDLILDTTKQKRSSVRSDIEAVSKKATRFYLRVDYGNYQDNFGQSVPFYNDGEYATKNDILSALTYFTEKDLLDSFGGLLGGR